MVNPQGSQDARADSKAMRIVPQELQKRKRPAEFFSAGQLPCSKLLYFLFDHPVTGFFSCATGFSARSTSNVRTFSRTLATPEE